MAETGDRFIHKYNSLLGEMVLASDGQALTGVWFAGQKYFPENIALSSQEKLVPVLAETVRWLDLYFAGDITDFMPALAPAGSAFRQQVWQLLLEIPYGERTSYGELAKILSEKNGGNMSAQAVRGAVGRNPTSILIPCHRVVCKDGSLTGYGGGLPRKKWLLDLEKKHKQLT